MPTYEYVCEKCDHTFDIFQSMKDDALTVCPKEQCGGRVKRVVGAGAGLIFKGSGFHITDYRSEGYKADAKKDAPKSGSDSKKASESKSGGSGTTDAKTPKAKAAD